jgi:hypothetical protein
MSCSRYEASQKDVAEIEEEVGRFVAEVQTEDLVLAKFPQTLFWLILSRLFRVVSSARFGFHFLLDLLNSLRDRGDNCILYLGFSDHQSQSKLRCLGLSVLHG